MYVQFFFLSENFKEPYLILQVFSLSILILLQNKLIKFYSEDLREINK